jgi:Ca2+-binding RTX toxin-like protein
LSISPRTDDPVTIEWGVTETVIAWLPHDQAVSYKLIDISGPSTLLLDGVEVALGQILDPVQFSALAFGLPSAANGLVTARFELTTSDGSPPNFIAVLGEIAPAMSASYVGSVGNDFLDGGAGNDRIEGLGGNDTVIGGTGNDQMNGGIGADNISGGAGNDRLVGGVGVDRMNGGAGNDAFLFNTTPSKANLDIISGFSNAPGNNDTFYLDNAYMPALGAPGMLNPSFFAVCGVARDADDHLFYNPMIGVLYYDANGNAPGGVAYIAAITNRPHLTASDFVVV